jgi:hypothetical protein
MAKLVFTLVIIAVLVVVFVWFFKKRRHNKNAALHPIKEDVSTPYVDHDTSSTVPFNLLNSLHDPPSLQEPEFVAEKLENEQEQISGIKSTSSQDVIAPIPNTVKQEIEEEIIETNLVNHVEEEERNITENNKHDVNESTSQVYVPTPDVSDVSETNNKTTQIDSTGNERQNQFDEIDQPKIGDISKPQRKRDPENRGGAHRGKRENDSNEPEVISEKTIRSSNPELVCWQQSRKWFLGVEISDNNLNRFEPTVIQASTKLNKSSDRWVLSNIESKVEISSQSISNIEIPVVEESNTYLLFKLSGQNLTQGRRVRYATSGTFLVVVPVGWKRNEELSGIPKIPPEPCHLGGYQAHYFDLDSKSDEHIVFITLEGKQVEIFCQRSQFEIIGSLIKDDNEIMGPLFGTSYPQLSCREKAVWQNISVIVLGEEGVKGSGWRTSFAPNREVLDQNLDSFLNNRLGGWYFVRIYNTSENLVESLDFRFALALENVGIDHHDVLPGNLGHKPVNITFFYNNHSLNKLECQSDSELPLLSKGKETTVEIPPKPADDKTNWIFWFNKNSNVEVSLLVERIWWCVCIQETNSQNILWSDKPVVLSPLHLAATSKHLLKIRLPRCRWTKEVQIGFEKRKARIYQVEVTKKEVEIPLNHLVDVSELEDATKNHTLNLWINDLPYQTIAVLTNRRRSAKLIRFNRRKTFKYLTRLHRTAKDIAFSEMVKQYKRDWSSTNTKKQSDDYFLQIACVIKVGYEVLLYRGNNKIGKEIRWLRSFINLAESNPDCLSDIKMKYETLSHNVKDSKL